MVGDMIHPRRGWIQIFLNVKQQAVSHSAQHSKNCQKQWSGLHFWSKKSIPEDIKKTSLKKTNWNGAMGKKNLELKQGLSIMIIGQGFCPKVLHMVERQALRVPNTWNQFDGNGDQGIIWTTSKEIHISKSEFNQCTTALTTAIQKSPAPRVIWQESNDPFIKKCRRAFSKNRLPGNENPQEHWSLSFCHSDFDKTHRCWEILSRRESVSFCVPQQWQVADLTFAWADREPLLQFLLRCCKTKCIRDDTK